MSENDSDKNKVEDKDNSEKEYDTEGDTEGEPEGDSEGSFEEMTPIQDIIPRKEEINIEKVLDFPVSWDLSEIRDNFRSSLEVGELMELLTFYQKLRNPDGDQAAANFDLTIPANKLLRQKLGHTYKRFIQEKVGQNQSVDFLRFLSNGYFEERSLINHYFDKIYILNLDRRPDRMKNMEKRLKKWGIYNWVRWSAIDGTQTPHWEEWKHYTKARLTRLEKIKYHRKAIASAGSWAILKSMYHLIRDAQKNNYERILVLQDDVLFHKNFQEEFLKVPKYIPDKKWKLLYLGGTQHNWNHILKSNRYYHPNGTADGAFAVGIHSKIYDELIGEILKFDLPVDSGALRTLQKRYLYQSYVLFPNLIIADIRDSDLRHSRDLVNFGKRFKWDVKLYDIDN